MANTFINKKADLTTTNATTLYTVPTATTSVIRSILVSEDSGNADTITVTIRIHQMMYLAYLKQSPLVQMEQQNY